MHTYYFDKEGAVDVQAIRDYSDIERNLDGSYNPSGNLIGLESLSQEEFDARDITPFLTPPETTASSGTS